jgi:hypothetical protein
MLCRSSTAVFALTTAVMVTVNVVQAAEEAKYPNWKGEWIAILPSVGGQGVRFDPTKPFGPAQEAPLTEEYKKIHEESMADQARGGQGNFAGHVLCMPGGMPAMLSAIAQEYIITPEITYISLGGELRRVFTDGRPWPTDLVPTFQGYSIGKWIDEDGDGVYDVLEVETRGPFKGPRSYDATGLPLDFDNESTFKERFFIDKKDPNLLHEVITVYDHALTRPWTVDKTYRRSTRKYPNWSHQSCTEDNQYVGIEKEIYFKSWDGKLMPAKKDQPPPDLKYFKQPSK